MSTNWTAFDCPWTNLQGTITRRATSALIKNSFSSHLIGLNFRTLLIKFMKNLGTVNLRIALSVEVSTGSGSDRVLNSCGGRARLDDNPVATAPGTDLII